MQFVNDDKRKYSLILNEALKPMLDFDSCAYAVNEITQEEYLKISDRIGGVAFLDVTGMTEGEILKDVCKLVLIDQARLVPDSYIDDLFTKRKVANLFRR